MKKTWREKEYNAFKTEINIAPLYPTERRQSSHIEAHGF